MDSRRIAGLFGGDRGGRLLAQYRPSDIGAQVLAAHGAAGSAFDVGAALGRDATLEPIGQTLQGHADSSSQLAGIANQFDGAFKW